MTKQVFRIAIVGGGTAGAASALFLARAGHYVTLFERVAHPEAVGAGILLQPTGMHVLHTLGLLDEILAHGTRNDRLFGTNSSGRTVLDIHYRDWNPSTFGLGLHRGALFSVLWNALRCHGIDVRTDAAVSHIQQTQNKAVLYRDDETIGEFDGIVLADGVHSILRDALSIPQKVTPYPWGALWAVLPDDGVTSGTLRQWFHHAKQMLGLMPTGFAYQQLTQPLISLFWSLPVNTADAWRKEGLDAWKNTVRELAPIDAVLDHIRSADQLTFATYADVRMKHWHDGRVVCIGDCAHATSPQLGQGANLALIDAMILAQCFSEGADIPSALAMYSRKRKDHLRYYQTTSKWLTPFFQSHSRLASGLRDLALGPICRAPYVKSEMARTLSGTKSGFLWGSLHL
ncbi:MAG: FAD-dependent monooxygenase [Burkholderiales bacterium]|nr:FAD-dependent monooxygenase [Burkholderiales bacterium]